MSWNVKKEKNVSSNCDLFYWQVFQINKQSIDARTNEHDKIAISTNIKCSAETIDRWW